MYDQSDLQHDEQMRVLEQIATALGAAATNPLTPADTTPDNAAGPFYATTSGTVYHRAGCPVVEHHAEDLRVIGADGLRGLRPCQICSPPG
jgi:hypothetical protein